jgi:glycogen operon protein
VVSQVKLIAEPWDIGEGGYQVGNFPPLWSEWNGRYRDEVRDYWRGDDQKLAELAARFTGSSDLYEATGRRPFASVNFITAHDGYTLHDLVSYEQKHNQANGEGNQDGTNDNRSWNSGAEGPTDDPAVNELRGRRARSIMATLLLSQGIPMILGGDEIGRTQGGNNNAYCQDNEISWFDWDHVDEQMLDFTRRLVAFRSRHPVFRRRRWFQGRGIHGVGVEDIGWFTSAGSEMTPEQWDTGYVKTLGIYLNGDAIEHPDERGRRIVDDTFYLLFNSHFDAVGFRLPPPAWSPFWTVVLDSADPAVTRDSGTRHAAKSIVTAPAWSLVVLQAGH